MYKKQSKIDYDIFFLYHLTQPNHRTTRSITLLEGIFVTTTGEIVVLIKYVKNSRYSKLPLLCLIKNV